MKNRYVFGGAAALAVLPVLYVIFPKSKLDDSIRGFETWEPTAEAIATAVGRSPGGKWDDERHTKFAELFKSRFRERQIAVGVKFEDDRVVRLLCAALIPRWDMARMAEQLANEVKGVFGRACRVDIYETYISSPHRKVAEANWNKSGDRLNVQFGYYPNNTMKTLAEMRAFRPYVLDSWFQQLPLEARALAAAARRMSSRPGIPRIVRPAVD
jgi:hypothetical protein